MYVHFREITKCTDDLLYLLNCRRQGRQKRNMYSVCTRMIVLVYDTCISWLLIPSLLESPLAVSKRCIACCPCVTIFSFLYLEFCSDRGHGRKSLRVSFKGC